MSHLTSDGEHIHATEAQPLNSVVPPDPAQNSDGRSQLADKTRELVDKAAAKLPARFENYPDTDAARERALTDSVRAGVVDDIPLEEQRKLYEAGPREV
ncbi:hypothetical protein PsYK624_118010 [Phanerochaete sordida]|uniref:Uncharacterized protein n=1 Tax=Phanerochaete sordida TaxID=48140 RepID=A0A9P3GIB6_9APHY|nr:hypothetical protein PsYK624_118010 [Phanerochaete sordida]